MSDKDELGAFLLGFIIGGLAGAATALLMAPQSGAETRTVIREKAIELKDHASSTYEEALAKAEAAAAEAHARYDELAEHAKKQASELQHRSKIALESVRKKESKGGENPAEA